MYKGREKYVGDSSRAVDRTYKGRAKYLVEISRAIDRIYKGRAKSVGDSSGAQKLFTECIRGEQNI